MRGGAEIMKKILLGICFSFICNFANAAVKVVNDITDATKINWSALDSAIMHLSDEDNRADIMLFFLEHEKDELSAQDILRECMNVVYYTDKSECADFVKTYMTYVDGSINNCTEATSLVGAKLPSHNFNTLADVFDALVSKRCYKDKYTYDQAFKIIEESLGSHFDPELGKAFIACRKELEAYYNGVAGEQEE